MPPWNILKYFLVYGEKNEAEKNIAAKVSRKKEAVMREQADLRALRQRHETSSVDTQYVQTFLKRGLTPYVENLLAQIREKPEETCELLRAAKRELTSLTGEPMPARYLLTLTVVIHILVSELQNQAQKAYDPTRPEKFIYLYDASYGVQLALSLLQDVYRELHGGTDYRQKLQLDPTGTADPPQFRMIDSFDEYKWAKQIVAAIDKLSLDPSGFSLLDEMVVQVEQDYKQSRTADLIIAGAQSGQQVYKALYPLTEGM